MSDPGAGDRRRVLVVEDDPVLARVLRLGLSGAGYLVETAADGEEALERVSRAAPELVVLDLMLPGLDGRQVCGRLREWSGVPIVVLSALDSETEKIALLDAGADDYVTKPFRWGELLARLRAAARRAGVTEPSAGTVRFSDVEVDLPLRSVRRAGATVHLTDTEYRLLRALARRPGRLLSHRALLEEVWGAEAAGQNHRVRYHLAALRRKLEPDPSAPRHLLTEPGVGCRLTIEPW